MAALLALSLAACEPAAPDTAEDTGGGWTGPARVLAAGRDGGGVRVEAQAAPRARVVLADSAGDPVAASADDEGRIVFRLASPAAPRLFAVETRDAAHGAVTLERILVLPDGQAAILAPGGAAWVAGAGLTAVDYDGGDLIASGRAAPGARVTIVVDDRPPVSATADSAGRFVAPLGRVGAGPVRIAIDGRTTDLDLAAPAGDALTVVRSGPGRAVVWPLPGGGAQWTWIADAG